MVIASNIVSYEKNTTVLNILRLIRQSSVSSNSCEISFQPVSRMCRSFSGLFPSVPPNTKSLLPTVVQVWLSLGVGAVPFTMGLLHVCLAVHKSQGQWTGSVPKMWRVVYTQLFTLLVSAKSMNKLGKIHAQRGLTLERGYSKTGLKPEGLSIQTSPLLNVLSYRRRYIAPDASVNKYNLSREYAQRMSYSSNHTGSNIMACKQSVLLVLGSLVERTTNVGGCTLRVFCVY